ncbi:hypothetical protein R1flu_009779 [Riccia fluitans]|uniref:Uncharacterized protein n=1 Tax=Riccia fluitans TaxID=41844 RepID=A0ABD1Z340_9MARC
MRDNAEFEHELGILNFGSCSILPRSLKGIEAVHEGANQQIPTTWNTNRFGPGTSSPPMRATGYATPLLGSLIGLGPYPPGIDLCNDAPIMDSQSAPSTPQRTTMRPEAPPAPKSPNSEMQQNKQVGIGDQETSRKKMTCITFQTQMNSCQSRDQMQRKQEGTASINGGFKK